MEKRLTRKNKMLLGVCGGIADYANMDPTLVRIIAVALIFFGIGSPILVYLVMAIIMPDETKLISWCNNEYVCSPTSYRKWDLKFWLTFLTREIVCCSGIFKRSIRRKLKRAFIISGSRLKRFTSFFHMQNTLIITPRLNLYTAPIAVFLKEQEL